MIHKKDVQPTVIYQVSGDELRNIIIEAVKDAVTSVTSQQAAPVTSEGDELMTAPEVCEFLHVTTATLHNWHKMKYLTKVKVGRRVLYHRSDVEALAAKTDKL